MGGHSAWKKRVSAGGLAKEGPGGAIARHRPRNGRKGEDLKLNRKGNIAGGNPKKQKHKKKKQEEEIMQATKKTSIKGAGGHRISYLFLASVVSILLAGVFYFFTVSRA